MKETIKNSLARTTIVLFSLFFAGCSCFVPWNTKFIVSGNPSDAKVVIYGEGTPVDKYTYQLRRDRNYRGTISREGYEDEHFYVTSSLGFFGTIDAICGCVWIVPFVGLAFPGSHSLDKDHYYYDLKPLKNN